MVLYTKMIYVKNKKFFLRLILCDIICTNI